MLAYQFNKYKSKVDNQHSAAIQKLQFNNMHGKF